MNKEDEIRRLWYAREPQQQTPQEAEKLADEAWLAGLRLARHPLTHYQYVMDLVRPTFRG
ncbi:hypothetical protein SerAS12_0315 [Serratia sp. AS12]|uniref:hypothetical protein n=1 Tax=Serratia TaxID=613 RepID=UPI00020E97C3|nr:MULTISPECIES: hypothetical protein [Serratia]AEF43476.1 hypothetical protein SerAS9_0315 [Serratia plymuthica AS9]AEF48428.1 hypothetical protein SerAS12_0315 [Serratia sp. AS12]AEG26136.1 hypothetical protein SerAS13_0314 [Serratia sp. AS13]UTN97039.1 hypothetical protein NLX81_01665 [Serratia plymuthica]